MHDSPRPNGKADKINTMASGATETDWAEVALARKAKKGPPKALGLSQLLKELLKQLGEANQ